MSSSLLQPGPSSERGKGSLSWQHACAMPTPAGRESSRNRCDEPMSGYGSAYVHQLRKTHATADLEWTETDCSQAH
eukprot:8428899-Heterocapsa_arctica.AAC.1